LLVRHQSEDPEEDQSLPAADATIADLEEEDPFPENAEKYAEKLLLEGAELVTGRRNRSHGDAQVNADRLAALWSALLGHHITPSQAFTMLVLLKAMRAGQGIFNADDFRDMAGYAALAGGVYRASDQPDEL